MAGLIRPIHVGPKSQSLQEMLRRRNDVDGRDKPGHDRVKKERLKLKDSPLARSRLPTRKGLGHRVITGEFAGLSLSKPFLDMLDQPALRREISVDHL